MILQYLLNATAIWLISLLVFDAALRRQRHHSYNRAYLLITIAAGLLLPLVHMAGSYAAPVAATMPAAHVIAAQQTIHAATVAVTPANGLHWLFNIYMGGMGIALALLLVDVMKLISYYSRGRKTSEANWTIVETHKEHAPFSFFGLLFVGSRKMYSDAEWRMLLVHEQRHRSLGHFADLLLMQLVRVAFWFHPLVYIYNSRMAMVHEYQADEASSEPLQVYGRFLVEQALHRSTPAISHALSNSPVKSRIQMLKRKPVRGGIIGQLLILPMIALFVVCFTRYDIDMQNEQVAQQNPYNNYNSAATYTYPTLPATTNEYAAQGNNASGAVRALKPNNITYNQGKHELPHGNGDVILLAGMENNNGGKCCSANLLWGASYSNAPVAGNAIAYEQVYMPEYAPNPCAPGYDAYRKEQYTTTVESYRHIQQAWSEQHQDDNAIAWQGMAGKATQLLVMDDPWSSHTDKSPGMVPPLSIDRSVFGAGPRAVFDGATAMATNSRGKAMQQLAREWMADAVNDMGALKVKNNKPAPRPVPYN